MPAVLHRPGRDGPPVQAVRVRVPAVRVVLAPAHGAGQRRRQSRAVPGVPRRVRRALHPVRRAVRGGPRGGKPAARRERARGRDQAEFGRERTRERRGAAGGRARRGGARSTGALRRGFREKRELVSSESESRHVVFKGHTRASASERGGPQEAVRRARDPARPGVRRRAHASSLRGGAVARDGRVPEVRRGAEDPRRAAQAGRRARDGLGVRHLRGRRSRRAVHSRRRPRRAGRENPARELRNHEILRELSAGRAVHEQKLPVPARRRRRHTRPLVHQRGDARAVRLEKHARLPRRRARRRGRERVERTEKKRPGLRRRDLGWI